MKKLFFSAMFLGLAFSAMAAYQYESKGNQGWLTFDSQTTVAFDLGRGGKDKDHENFIDRGEGVELVYGTSLENWRAFVAYRGFESHPLRQKRKLDKV